MNQETKLIAFTHLEADFFQYDENGDLPYTMLLATADNPDYIVADAVQKIIVFWTEWLRQHPTEFINLEQTTAAKISFENDEHTSDITINSDTLILVLSYSENRERIVTLELSPYPITFTLH